MLHSICKFTIFTLRKKWFIDHYINYQLIVHITVNIFLTLTYWPNSQKLFSRRGLINWQIQSLIKYAPQSIIILRVGFICKSTIFYWFLFSQDSGNLLAHKSAANPLWLSLACEEIRLHGDYSSLSRWRIVTSIKRKEQDLLINNVTNLWCPTI